MSWVMSWSPMPSRYRVRAALLAVALLLVAGCGGSDDDDGDGAMTPAAASTSALPGALESGPPWPANNAASLQRSLREIGLQPLREEGQVLHIHQHLDIWVDGRKVTVPAQIGIDANQGFISDLHTHETDGIMPSSRRRSGPSRSASSSPSGGCR